MQWLALDIGGANLKVADGLGHAESFPFALWREPEHLVQELRTLIAQSPRCDRLAVTMTGELADCFENKTAGVTFILDAVQQAADGRHT
ncbi:MAG: H4MPT-linked C1 transfer pathway protein, partial [Planctomycetota bacterium]